MAKAKKARETRKTYILLRGRHHRMEGVGKARTFTHYAPGDEILLNEHEFGKLGGLKGERLGLPDDGKPELTKKGKPAFKIDKVEGGFNVINVATGKTVNDEPLTKEQAEEIAGT